MESDGEYARLIQTHHSKPDVEDEEEAGEDKEWSEGGVPPQRQVKSRRRDWKKKMNSE